MRFDGQIRQEWDAGATIRGICQALFAVGKRATPYFIGYSNNSAIVIQIGSVTAPNKVDCATKVATSSRLAPNPAASTWAAEAVGSAANTTRTVPIAGGICKAMQPMSVMAGRAINLIAQIAPLKRSNLAKAPQFIVAPTEMSAIGIAAAANI